MDYFTRLINVVTSLKDVAVLDELASDLMNGSAAICGNGGSAAISNHFAADLNKTLGRHVVTSFCENQSLITALANDVSYDQVFSEQLKMSPIETLICVSSSGSSVNVVNAARAAMGRGVNLYVLTGFSSGNMLNSMVAQGWGKKFHVDSMNYGIVEDIHMSALHSVIEKCKELNDIT